MPLISAKFAVYTVPTQPISESVGVSNRLAGTEKNQPQLQLTITIDNQNGVIISYSNATTLQTILDAIDSSVVQTTSSGIITTISQTNLFTVTTILSNLNIPGYVIKRVV